MSEEEGDCCPCCPCCELWEPQQERAATEIIHMNSKYRIIGHFIDCPQHCYNRHTLQKIYITTAIIFALFLMVVLIYFGAFYQPAVYLEKFKPANCTVLEVDYENTAHCSFTQDDEVHNREFTCLRVVVQYDVDGKAGGENSSVITRIYEGYKELFNDKGICSYSPSNCASEADTERDINEQIEYYTTGDGANATIDCYYNPKQLHELVIVANTGVHPFDVRKVLGILICVVLLLFSVIILAFLTCGCDFVCMSKVPSEINDHLWNKGRSLVRHGEKPILYTAGPIQIPAGAEAHELQPLDSMATAWHRAPPAIAPPVPLIIPRDPPPNQPSAPPPSPPPPYKDEPGASGGAEVAGPELPSKQAPQD